MEEEKQEQEELEEEKEARRPTFIFPQNRWSKKQFDRFLVLQFPTSESSKFPLCTPDQDVPHMGFQGATTTTMGGEER